MSVETRSFRIRHLFDRDRFNTDPFLAPAQWHIWTDGLVAVSAMLIGGVWQKGPPVEYADTNATNRIASLADDMLKRGYNGQKTRNLGVILHSADDLILATVKAEMSTPDKYDLCEGLIVDDPASVLDAKPTAQSCYRYIPTPGNRKAVAAMAHSDRGTVLLPLASSDLGISVAVVLAPLEMVSIIPAILGPHDAGDGVTHDVVVLQYHRMTLVSIFQRPTDELPGGLCGLINMPHGSRGGPSQAGERIKAELMGRGAKSLAVFVLQASPSVDIAPLLSDIKATMTGFKGQVMVGGIPAASIEGEMRSLNPDLPIPEGDFFRPEFLTARRRNDSFVASNAWNGGDHSAAVQVARAATQNLSDHVMRGAEARLTYSDGALVAAGRIMSWLLIIAAITCIISAGLFVRATLTSPSWLLKEEQAEAAKERLVGERQIEAALVFWRDATIERSQAWRVLEQLCAIIPGGKGGVISRQLAYKLEPLLTATAGGKPPARIGFRRLWTITGAATEAGTASLDSMGQSTIEMAVAQGVDSPAPKGGGAKPVGQPYPLTVNMERTVRRGGPINGENYPTDWLLKLAQVIPATAIPESIPAGKSPQIPPPSKTTQP
jgi:hypothetical protein